MQLCEHVKNHVQIVLLKIIIAVIDEIAIVHVAKQYFLNSVT